MTLLLIISLLAPFAIGLGLGFLIASAHYENRIQNDEFMSRSEGKRLKLLTKKYGN